MSDMPFNQNANNMPSPADARNLAAQLHQGQKDHSGEDYILHPERVKNNLLAIFPDASPAVIMAAWLHDTMEDCKINGEFVDENYLRNLNYPEETIAMVRLLTKPEDDERNYDEVIDDLIKAGNVGAIMVKIADNMDNLHPIRTEELKNSQMEKDNPGKAQKLFDRYTNSIQRLAKAIDMDTNTIFKAIQNAQPLKTKFEP